MKKTILAVIAALLMQTGLVAGEDFSLGLIHGLKTGKAQGLAVSAPMPVGPAGPEKSPDMAPALDMTLKLTFASLNKRLSEMFAKQFTGPAATAQLQVIDASSPVISRRGDQVVLTNLTVDYKGIKIEPTVLLKPFFEGNNRLALKFGKIELERQVGPKGLEMPKLDKNEIMALVADKLTTAMLASMDKAFAGNKVQLKAADVMAFSYDKLSWTLHAVISPDFVAPLLPGLIENINFTSFSFDDSGFALGVQTGVGIAQLKGYNLALSDGLITSFVRKYTDGTDFNLASEKKFAGGIKFKADGRMELAGKVYARDVFLKPNVYFIATMQPKLTAANIITLKIERIEVDKAYGIGVPGFLNDWLQNAIISRVVAAVATNPNLVQAVKARKLDNRTVEFSLDKAAFLPSFAEGAAINKLFINKGLMYLSFDL